MTMHDIRHSIHQILEKTDDRNVLETYHEILKNLVKLQNNQIIGYDTDGEPITRAGLDKSITKAQENIKSGDVIGHDDLMSDSENW